jgi:hypothetical protein
MTPRERELARERQRRRRARLREDRVTSVTVTGPPVTGVEGRSDALSSWDLAFDEADASSYVVGQAWARVGANRYLLEQVREGASFANTIPLVTGLATRWPRCRPIFVETARTDRRSSRCYRLPSRGSKPTIPKVRSCSEPGPRSRRSTAATSGCRGTPPGRRPSSTSSGDSPGPRTTTRWTPMRRLWIGSPPGRPCGRARAWSSASGGPRPRSPGRWPASRPSGAGRGCGAALSDRPG